MRKIRPTGAYRRDVKREIKGVYKLTLADLINPVIDALADDAVLDDRYRDHAMTGNWKGARNCHVKPDLILLYQKPDNDSLLLIRLGSHAELGIK